MNIYSLNSKQWVGKYWLFLVGFLLSIIVGWFASAKTHPFANPDEGAHFLRSYEVSHGKLINSRGHIGVEMPCREYFLVSAKYAPIAFYEDVTKREDFGSDTCFVKTKNTAGTYSPISYIFLAPAEFIGRLNSLVVEERLILMRFFNFFGTALLFLLSFSLLMKFRFPLIFLAYSPLIIWLRASVSADGVTIALAMLFVSYVFYLTKEENLPSLRKILYLLLLAGFVGACKPVYSLVCLSSVVFFFTNWGRKQKKINNLILIFSPVFIALLVSIIFIKVADPDLVYLGNNANPKNQLSWIVKNFGDFLSVIYLTFTTSGWSYLYQVWVPYTWVPVSAGGVVATTMTIFLLLLTVTNEKMLELKSLISLMVLFFLMAFAIIFPLYLTYNPPGYKEILGLQGRYFIPNFILMIFALSGLANKIISMSAVLKETIASFFPLLICTYLIFKYLNY